MNFAKGKGRKAKSHITGPHGKKTYCGRPVPTNWAIHDEPSTAVCWACSEVDARRRGADDTDDFGRFYENGALT